MNRVREPGAAPRGLHPRMFSTPLSVVKGRELRTSHTFTHPSWLATAYLRPSEDHAVLNAASLKTSEYVAIGEKITLFPPDIVYRYTDGVSPTASSVRPSGDIEAAMWPENQPCALFAGRAEGSHTPWFTHVFA